MIWGSSPHADGILNPRSFIYLSGFESYLQYCTHTLIFFFLRKFKILKKNLTKLKTFKLNSKVLGSNVGFVFSIRTQL